ncbi:MAG: sigma-54 interaction domain-containing protein [Pontibacterium sp.]
MMNFTQHLILVDDSNDNYLSTCVAFLGLKFQQLSYSDGLQQGDIVGERVAPVLFLGFCLSPAAAGPMINRLAAQRPDLPVIAYGIDQQASDLLSDALKPLLVGCLLPGFGQAQFIDLLHKAQAFRSQRNEAVAKHLAGFDRGLPGVSEAMQQVRLMVAKVGTRDVSVLITGQPGIGKEVVARSLHEHSSRFAGPFVPVNCGAMPSELLESELFGHEKGAFTGAVNSRAGRFEIARGGTLFLDEIGDMPLSIQVKILRVIQERKFERVGGTKTWDADVRIIAATSKNLEQMIETNEFREDLYFRLNVFPIDMPPLRERVEDIPVLLEEMVRRASEQGLGCIIFHPSAIQSLQVHPWPGNERELSGLVERLVIMYPDAVVGVTELPDKFQHIEEPDPARYPLPLCNEIVVSQRNALVEAIPVVLPEAGINLKAHLESLEQGLIEQALDAADGVVARAADKLEVRRTTLVEKMRKYGIQRK